MSWDRHPAIRTGSNLTRGERAADTVRNNMGSWPFVLIAAKRVEELTAEVHRLTLAIHQHLKAQ